MPGNMLPRTCRQCGLSFLGGPRAWYCPKCRADRARDANKKFKDRKRAGDVIPLGSILVCPDCGKEFVKTGGNSTRFPACAEKHLKEVDHAQSLAWNKLHPEKQKESKRKHSAKNSSLSETCESGVTGISWDKSGKRWQVSVYDNKTKKQVYVGKSISLDTAKAMLENCEVLEYVILLPMANKNAGNAHLQKCFCRRCGNTFYAASDDVRNGSITSCGCYNDP